MVHPLDSYLKDEKIDVPSFSETVKCSDVQIYRIIAGSRFPSRGLAKRIEKKTKGKVLASQLLFPQVAQ